MTVPNISITTTDIIIVNISMPKDCFIGFNHFAYYFT